VKIGPVFGREQANIMENALRVHVVRRILSNISGYTGPIFTIFSPYESALHKMMDRYLIFRFLKGRCHGNQIICERQVRHGPKTGIFCLISPDKLD